MLGRKKILIVADDHPIVRRALEQVVAGLHPYLTLYRGGEADALLGIVRQRQEGAAELTVVDVALPDDAATPRHIDPATPLMMVAAQNDGIEARWFVPIERHDASAQTLEAAFGQREAVLELIQGLRDAARHAGRSDAGAPAGGGLPTLESLVALGLTQRQAEVLGFLAEGLSNKEIARKLDVSEWTVRHHVSAILERLEVSNRMRAANIARQLGHTPAS